MTNQSEEPESKTRSISQNSMINNTQTTPQNNTLLSPIGWYTEPLKENLNQYTITDSLAIRRPHAVPHEDLIRKTLDKATAEGKAYNTVLSLSHRLSELSSMTDLLNPEAVKTAIGKAPLKDSSKASMVFAYNWFCKVNDLKWEKPKYTWQEHVPIIPTTDSVTKIITASTKKYATIFTIMAETGIEGEELHRLHRNKIDTQQGIISIDGTKGHTSGVYKLKSQTAEMLREYLARYQQEYPFPQPKVMSKM